MFGFFFVVTYPYIRSVQIDYMWFSANLFCVEIFYTIESQKKQIQYSDTSQNQLDVFFSVVAKNSLFIAQNPFHQILCIENVVTSEQPIKLRNL